MRGCARIVSFVLFFLFLTYLGMALTCGAAYVVTHPK